VNMYNGGSVTNIKSERKIKVERAEAEQTSWAAMVNGVNHTQQGPRPVHDPYSKVVPTNGGGLVLGNNVQFASPQTNSEFADLNQVLAAQDYGQPYGSPYSDNSQSSYDNNMPQQSPDPQGLANMNIASPIGIQSPDPTIAPTAPISSVARQHPFLHSLRLTRRGGGGGITLNVSGVRLSMGAVVRLIWQAHRHGHTLAITPTKGKIIIVPKFRIVHR